MSGKHYQHLSGSVLADAFKVPPLYPGSRLDRAYAEGRLAAKNGAAAITNPFAFGVPEFNAWSQGWSRNQPASEAGWEIQTGIAKGA